MMLFGGFALISIVLLALVCLRSPPDVPRIMDNASSRPEPSASLIGLRPNVVMGLLMVAIFCCCVPMSMPMQHVVAFCGDLGFEASHSAAMLAVLLGSAFLSRMLWGWCADRMGGLQTLLLSSLAQLVSMSGFLVTQNETALFVVSAAFGIGFSGLLPAYIVTIREFYPIREANWRIPMVLFAGFSGMAMGGWGAGALYDVFGYYIPAFGAGIVLNVANLVVLLPLVLRQREMVRRPVMA
jgi:predicted MFS family arabinose efflux permease